MLDQRRHIVELQSMRGFASIVVLASHCFSYYITPINFQRLKNILFNGQGGVVLFFVLSGFVLGRSLRDAPVDWRNLCYFYVKRAFRIYPALWTASAVGLVYIVFFHWSSPHPGVSSWLLARYKHDRFAPIPFIAAMAGALGLLIPPVWTIFNEVLESIVLPLTSRLSFNRPRWGVALAIALGLVSITVGPYTYYGVLLYPVDFQVGVLIAVYFSGPHKLTQPLWFWPLVLAAGACTLFSLRGLIQIGDPGLSQNDPLMHLVELAGSAAIIIAIIARPVGVLRIRLIKDLGDISYSVYLLHFPVMCLCAVALSHVIAHDDLTPLESILLFIMTLAATVAAAAVVYRFVELPSIAQGRALADRIRRKTPVPVGPNVEFGA
jgi:peptidoglycan/LPS O-acetylase OafA/YrhL